MRGELMERLKTEGSIGPRTMTSKSIQRVVIAMVEER